LAARPGYRPCSACTDMYRRQTSVRLLPLPDDFFLSLTYLACRRYTIRRTDSVVQQVIRKNMWMHKCTCIFVVSTLTNHRINVHQALKFGTPVREVPSFACQVSNCFRPWLGTIITEIPEMFLFLERQNTRMELLNIITYLQNIRLL
jgi:hypothetical protein